MDEYWGIPDLMKRGYFDSDPQIRQRVRDRRLPKPLKIGGKLKWKASVIREWIENGTLRWIPRSNNR